MLSENETIFGNRQKIVVENNFLAQKPMKKNKTKISSKSEQKQL